jgi:L-fucose isomerase-like protein
MVKLCLFTLSIDEGRARAHLEPHTNRYEYAALIEMNIAVIVGNREFFPDHVCESGRDLIVNSLKARGVRVIALSPEDTVGGATQTRADVEKTVNLLQTHRHEIDGIVITLPNFGTEKAIVESIAGAELRVPIWVHAFDDDLEALDVENRRDSFCGKISVCNNLHQFGLPFTLPELHTDTPDSESFQADLDFFLSVCRVVRSLSKARFGAVGARPEAFNTVRYSEKLLQKAGITVDTLDLSEVFGRANRLPDDDAAVVGKLDELEKYMDASGVPAAQCLKMAKLAVALEAFIREFGWKGIAVQCWNSIQTNYGVSPCAVMSLLGEGLCPAACEVDVTGLVAMYALQQASGQPSALMDWNNNYARDREKCILFHCGNFPRSFYSEAKIDHCNVLARTLGKENCCGGINGRVKSGHFTFARVSTDDSAGAIRAYVGEGSFTDDPLNTFGSRGVAKVVGLQNLMRHICKYGFEHHVAVNFSQTAAVLAEAFETYFGWDVYFHRG